MKAILLDYKIMNLHRSMALFIEIAHEGSLAAAGRKLGLSPPSASRLLNDLEKWLGQPLVRRSTRHVSLTELGESYLPRCIDIVENIQSLKSGVTSQTGPPSGPLRITVAGIIARRIVAPVIPRFLTRHPEVTLHLDTTSEFVEIMSGKIDLAIRVGDLKDSSLVAKKICDTQTILVASPAFLEQHGVPEGPEDLPNFPCLIDTVPLYGARWPFLRKKRVKGPAMISDGEIIRDLTLSGLGIAYLPELLVRDELREGHLTELLPDVAPRSVGIYTVFPPREYISPAARIFAEAVRAEYA